MPVLTAAAFMVGASSTKAYTVTGGDAVDQASADAVVDIVFAFDTSGSMTADITAIRNAINTVLANLDCPDIDIWVRARLTGIAANSVFGENVRSVDIANNGSSSINSTEDNGPVVNAIIDNSSTYFVDDTTASQTYHQAVVSVGDEGTQNGAPVGSSDWNAAYSANQAAINSGTLLFTWLGSPFPGSNTDVALVFEAMAEGGARPATDQNGNPLDPGPALGDTGGIFVEQSDLAAAAVEARLEHILCLTGTGGTPTPDGGSSILMLGAALGLFSLARRNK